MKHLFVPYEIALQLKEKGFDELCFGWWCWINGNAAQYYDYKISNSQLIELNNHFNNCSAPLYQQVIDWLESEKRLLIDIAHHYYFSEKSINTWHFEIMTRTGLLKSSFGDNDSDSRQEATLKAIEEALKLI